MDTLKSKSIENHLKNHPLVSIITPTYNHEKFIGSCIESVLKQTYENWEMIIIDDGSTDNTRAIIAQYNDYRIKYVKQENLGIYKLDETYNKALNISKGDLIAILEGDDLWPNYKLEEQVKIFQENDIILSWGRMNTINDRDEIVAFGMETLKHFQDMPREELIRNLITDNFIKACTVMIERAALLKIGGFLQDENVPFVDYNTFLALSITGRFYPSDNVMGYWRRHGTQVTNKKLTEMTNAFMVSLDFYEKLDSSIKKSIKFDRNIKLKFYDNLLSEEKLLSARIDLLKGKWSEASYKFKSLSKKGNFSAKFQSILGLICILFRRDLEWLAVLSCRPKLRDVSGEWDTTLYDKNGHLSLLFHVQIYIWNVYLRLLSRPTLNFKT